MRSVRTVTMCRNAFPRRIPVTRVASSFGTVVWVPVGSSRISVRASPVGTFSCHPVSVSPVRHRRVIPRASRSWSSVSKYTLSNRTPDRSTRPPPSTRPSRVGSTTSAAASNFVSRSRCSLATAAHSLPRRHVPVCPRTVIGSPGGRDAEHRSRAPKCVRSIAPGAPPGVAGGAPLPGRVTSSCCSSCSSCSSSSPSEPSFPTVRRRCRRSASSCASTQRCRTDQQLVDL